MEGMKEVTRGKGRTEQSKGGEGLQEGGIVSKEERNKYKVKNKESERKQKKGKRKESKNE